MTRRREPDPKKPKQTSKPSAPSPEARASAGEVDLGRVRTVPVLRRPNKVSAEEFAKPPGRDRSFHAFLDSLPDILVARDFRRVVDAIASAADEKRGVVLMLGGHIVKTGLAPLLVRLLTGRRRFTISRSRGSAERRRMSPRG
jgi:hypothetical protein